MDISCKIDTTNWMRGQQLLMANSKTAPGQSLATAAAFVIHSAKDKTPVTPQSRIDRELSVTATPILSSRGKRKGMPLRSGRKTVAINGDGASNNPFAGVPLTWLLVGARAKADSNFNTLTGGRWQIGAGVDHPFKGRRVSEFKGIMAARVQRMVANRHSSTNFMQISWNSSLASLVKYVKSGYKSQVRAWAGKQGAELSDTQVSGDGTARVQIQLDNKLGMANKYANLDKQRNAAVHRILGPVLQRAIDQNFEEQIALATRKGWIELGPALKMLGMSI